VDEAGAISNERVFVGDEVAPSNPINDFHFYKLLCERVLGYITLIGAICDQRVFVGDKVAPPTNNFCQDPTVGLCPGTYGGP
jgi:hypothetical protein